MLSGFGTGRGCRRSRGKPGEGRGGANGNADENIGLLPREGPVGGVQQVSLLLVRRSLPSGLRGDDQPSLLLGRAEQAVCHACVTLVFLFALLGCRSAWFVSYYYCCSSGYEDQACAETINRLCSWAEAKKQCAAHVFTVGFVCPTAL